MKFTRIVVAILLLTYVASERAVTGQEIVRDALYSRFEEYYSTTPQNQIRARLDAFAQQLKLNPSQRALVISYGGRKSCRNEALLRARQATGYLSQIHGISPELSTTLNGGYRDHWVVVWVGSPTAKPPTAAKTISKKLVSIKGNCKLIPINGSP